MSVTTPLNSTPTAPQAVPEPVTAAEDKGIEASPEPMRAEEQSVADSFNQLVEKDAGQASEAEAAAAEKDPGVEQAAQDVTTVIHGGTVALPGIEQDATRLVKEVKAGYKTSEFWVAAVVIILAQVGALHLPGKYGSTITTAAAGGAYIISRGLAK